MDFCLSREEMVEAAKEVLWSLAFDTSSRVRTDLPEWQLNGKVAIVTGANIGIGLETAKILARLGARVIIGCRDKTRGEEACAVIREFVEKDTSGYSGKRVGTAEYLPLDLGKFESVRNFAKLFRVKFDKLNILVCNAGLMFPRFELSPDGFEYSFAVNHLGHFLLIQLLLDPLLAAPPSRVLLLSSSTHTQGRVDWSEFEDYKNHSYNVESRRRGHARSPAYCQSKLLNLFVARELDRRFRHLGLSSYAVHPGVVSSNILRDRSVIVQIPAKLVMDFLFKTPFQGAQTTVYLAAVPEVDGRGGSYWCDCHEIPPSASAMSDDGPAVWEKSLALVQLKPHHAESTVAPRWSPEDSAGPRFPLPWRCAVLVAIVVAATWIGIFVLRNMARVFLMTVK